MTSRIARINCFQIYMFVLFSPKNSISPILTQIFRAKDFLRGHPIVMCYRHRPSCLRFFSTISDQLEHISIHLYHCLYLLSLNPPLSEVLLQLDRPLHFSLLMWYLFHFCLCFHPFSNLQCPVPSYLLHSK